MDRRLGILSGAAFAGVIAAALFTTGVPGTGGADTSSPVNTQQAAPSITETNSAAWPPSDFAASAPRTEREDGGEGDRSHSREEDD